MCTPHTLHRYIPLLLNFMDEVHDVEELDHDEMQQHQHHLKQIKHATHHMRPSNLHLVNHVCIILQVLYDSVVCTIIDIRLPIGIGNGITCPVYYLYN